MVELTAELLERLAEAGLEVLHGPGTHIPDDIVFEPPCSIKWMEIHHYLRLGAFSYAVRGFYFNARVGRYTSMGEDVQIGRSDHPVNWLSTSPAFYLDGPDMFQVGTGYAGGDAYKNFVPAKLDKSPTTMKLTSIGHDVYVGHGALSGPESPSATARWSPHTPWW